MYKIPENFTIPPEVKKFDEDCDEIGILYDMDNWYITEDWTKKFKKHELKLKSVAEKGNPWAQYKLGNMYFTGYTYSSQKDFDKNYEQDIITGSFWLEKCAKQGFVAAVDNLVCQGTGEETERLREITKQVEKSNPEHIQKWKDDENIPVIMPSLFEAVWEIAYGKKS